MQEDDQTERQRIATNTAGKMLGRDVDRATRACHRRGHRVVVGRLRFQVRRPGKRMHTETARLDRRQLVGHIAESVMRQRSCRRRLARPRWSDEQDSAATELENRAVHEEEIRTSPLKLDHDVLVEQSEDLVLVRGNANRLAFIAAYARPSDRSGGIGTGVRAIGVISTTAEGGPGGHRRAGTSWFLAPKLTASPDPRHIACAQRSAR
jgi:hypothetical protein